MGRSQRRAIPKPCGSCPSGLRPHCMRLCDFGEFGHKESQRYRHIYLTHAACGAVGDALGCGGRIFDQFLEPTAPLRNPSNQRPLSCQTEWDAGAAAMVQRAEEFRDASLVKSWSKECGACLCLLVGCRLQFRFGSIRQLIDQAESRPAPRKHRQGSGRRSPRAV